MYLTRNSPARPMATAPIQMNQLPGEVFLKAGRAPPGRWSSATFAVSLVLLAAIVVAAANSVSGADTVSGSKAGDVSATWVAVSGAGGWTPAAQQIDLVAQLEQLARNSFRLVHGNDGQDDRQEKYRLQHAIQTSSSMYRRSFSSQKSST